MAAIMRKDYLAFIVTPCIRFPGKGNSNEQMSLCTIINDGNRFETEEDRVIWSDEGEKRNSYIPSRPVVYYGNLGH